MKSNGYKVEFLPLERRMLERRFIEAASSSLERRFSERREIADSDTDDPSGLDHNPSQPLSH